MMGSHRPLVPVTEAPASPEARGLRHYELRVLAEIVEAAQRSDTAEVVRLAALLGPAE
jgi:hypothetical protein